MIRIDSHRPAVARALLAVALVASTLGGTVVRAQTRPAVEVPTQTSAYAGAEIRRSTKNAPTTATESGEASAAAKPSSGLDTGRVLLSLGVVLVLIFALRFFGQKWFAPAGARSSGRTVETLSRAMIGPKQQVLLIRVGKRRVLVVGDSGGKLSSLDQITDAGEIAELVGQIHTEKLGPTATAFAGLFGKNAEKFAASEVEKTETVETESNVEAVSSTQRDLQSLLSKVRRVSGKLEA